MSHPRRTVLALVIALLLVSTASLSASDQELVHRNWSRSMSVGASVVGGTPTGDPVQLVSGIAGSEYTSTRGGAIEATDDAIVLRRDGTYQIQLEGTVFFSSADATVDPDASGLFTIWIGGPFAVCSFSSAQDAPILPEMMQFPGLDRVAQCRVTLTLEVDRDGSELALPRDTPVQFALMPNERSLGEGSLFLVRIEVNRLGP